MEYISSPIISHSEWNLVNKTCTVQDVPKPENGAFIATKTAHLLNIMKTTSSKSLL